jgi:nicotinate-nucleotide adenylyltransferase
MAKGRKIKTGLFFGSFNPIHTGHLIIASHLAEHSDLKEIWFVVSPHNPLKTKKSLLADHHRLALVDIAIEDDDRFRSSNIEFYMPQPSYTIDTLVRLEEKHPNHEFILIAGSDIFPTFHKWKNYEQLLESYRIYVYNRPGYSLGKYLDHPSIRLFHAPLLQISSSFIRKSIKEGKDVRYLMPERVREYVREMHFYEGG